MKKQKIIWFGGDQKPVRSGVYKRKYLDGSINFCFFDARTGIFGSCADTEDRAEFNYIHFAPSIAQNLSWGGIKK
tara:strand:+ start:8762 stop:8986 length:225 start_codon:yes stop_codon:yes gene_type:complete